MVDAGILTKHADGNQIFSEDYAFKSPSAAASVVNGRPTNGTTAWKERHSGKTYKEWEADSLNDTADI
ncbi:DUF4357 domain-containing protein [Yunchengibacter salinarum]|uniref:DUF4357 domain-containing protein n=1 Tax=Yunchengibacter salinarum TaxID=3133399 RepID=UPI0035B61C2D